MNPELDRFEKNEQDEWTEDDLDDDFDNEDYKK